MGNKQDEFSSEAFHNLSWGLASELVLFFSGLYSYLMPASLRGKVLAVMMWVVVVTLILLRS